MSQSAREQGSEETGTVRSRIRQYERRERMILWVGAGLVGLIALVAGVGGSSEGANAILRAIAITAIVVAGGSLAYARVNFEWQATLINRKIEDDEIEASSGLGALPEEMQGWPNDAELAWHVGLKAIIVAAVAFLGSVWGAAL